MDVNNGFCKSERQSALEGPAGMICCIQGQKDIKAKLSVSSWRSLGKVKRGTVQFKLPLVPLYLLRDALL